MHGYSTPLFVVCCVGGCFCDGLMARSEESYRAQACASLIVCDLET